MSTTPKKSSGSEKRINIFLCHNPFHVYICNQICKSRFNTRNFTNLIICSVERFTRVEEADYMILRNGLSGRVTSYWQAKVRILKASREYGYNAEFFLPHVGGVLGNYIFESKALLRNGSKISFYYEGTAMVDNRRKERKIELFDNKKRIAGMMIFHWFVKHQDILPLDSSKIHKVYTPYPERTVAPIDKKELIAFPRAEMQKGTGGILIVGVDAGDALQEATESLIAYIRDVQQTSKGPVFFKPHYADRLNVFQKEAKKSGFDYTLVNDSRCIEEIIGELPVETIICTHFSSALLNLKLLYKNDLNVIFLAHPKAIGVLGEEYVELILSVGVEVINLSEAGKSSPGQKV